MAARATRGTAAMMMRRFKTLDPDHLQSGSVVKIAPSLLSADFGRLDAEIASVTEGGADLLHLDVMDGHFVPNLTFGPFIVEAIRKLTDLPLDCHLMIEDPLTYGPMFASAGACLPAESWRVSSPIDDVEGGP